MYPGPPQQTERQGDIVGWDGDVHWGDLSKFTIICAGPCMNFIILERVNQANFT